MSVRQRRRLLPVIFLMLAGAVAELISIGAVIPFIAVVADPEGAMAGTPFRGFLERAGFGSPAEIIATAAVAFAMAAILAAGVRLLLAWASQRYVFGLAHEIGVAVYSRTLHQPYAYHTSRNSSETLAAINKTQIAIGQLLMPLMQGVSAFVIAIFILAGLIYIDPVAALAAGSGFAAIYLLVMRITRGIMRRNGIIIAKAHSERLQAASEGLGGIRDVLLDRTQPVFVARFDEIEKRLRDAQAINGFISQAPRYIVEGVGIVLIAGLALALSLRDGGLLAAVPVLGALALGAQRLVPLMQVLFSGWAAMLGNGRMLLDIVDILRLPEAPQFLSYGGERLSFERDIVLENVGFSYPSGSRPALDKIDLRIPSGTRIGFAGKTGSGKSTLVDLVLGLLDPSSGRILIDGAELNDANRSAWQAQIAHVPQAIYLADASIAENIAFGVPPENIDREWVAHTAAQAELSEVIEALPNGYDTFVGERGIRLSGGQRQRIGIARALYKRARVLVFDEATSALDNETESAVMEAIGRLSADLTVLIIAHRLSTLDGCDMIVKLEGGRVKEVENREDMTRNSGAQKGMVS
ncbi:MAG: ABC transporter ATP-binding protein/permease [Parvibaculum sp.]|nr:ABC transporter ATP-binding protein/permease [Parvibaculum sp.]